MSKAVELSSSAVLRVRPRELEDAFIEAAQDERAEVDGIDAIGDVLEGDVLAGEDVGDVEEAVIPADGAIATDSAELEVGGIMEDRQCPWEDPSRGSVEVGGDIHG